MHGEGLNLSAPKEKIEHVTTSAFSCPVKPEEAKAKYENGLLKIEAPFKHAVEDAIKVKVG